MDDHLGNPVEKFGGIFDRGGDIPINHFLKAHNMTFSEDEFHSRFGFTKNITIPTVKRAFVYKRIGEAPRYIILSSDGNFYDSLNLAVPILTIPGCEDFYLANFYNRAYITPHNGVTGLPGEYIYVYNGSGTARPIGGTKPTGFSLSFTTGAAGSIENGLHLFAIAFETTSGFITRPGPTEFQSYSAPGDKTLTIDNIPIGGDEVVARWIIGTSAIQDYSGNQDDYEIFFIERIGNNVDTSVNIDFLDNELIDSADYLLEQIERPAACLAITEYKGRMVTWATQADPSLILCSKKGEPESISSLSGFIITDPKEMQSVRNCFEYRDLLIVCKPLQTYGYADSGSEPVTWNPTSIDKGKGTEVFGVANVLDIKGNTDDRVIIANQEGLHVFIGYYANEISWKISKIWNRINKLYFNTVQVYQDTNSAKIYIAIPLDNATSPSHILVCDYDDGLDEKSVRWSLWQMPFKPTSIMLDVNTTTSKTQFKVGSSDGNIYVYDETSHLDDNVAINSYCQTKRFTEIGGQVQHLGNVRLKIKGNGNLKITCFDGEEEKNKVLKDIVIPSKSNIQIVKKCEFFADEIMIRFEVDAANEWFNLYRYVPYINVLDVERPQ